MHPGAGGITEKGGVTVNLYHDHFQNYKRYNIPKAQLIIADIPFNLGNNAYASNPAWYKDGDNKNGESELAGKQFFDTDKDFRIAEFMHFVSTMLKKEPKEKGQAGCMIVFCEFEQQFMLIEKGKEYGFNHYINLYYLPTRPFLFNLHSRRTILEGFISSCYFLRLRQYDSTLHRCSSSL